MSFMQNIKKGLFGEDDGYDDQYIDDGPQMVNNNSGFGSSDSYDEDSGEGSKSGNRVVNINATTQLKVVLLNLESTNKEVSRRLVDFLSGVAYANNGQIKRVANSTFIITPYNVDIMGDLLDELENNGAFY